MFKQGSCANEVAEAMVANLERNKPVFQASISKIASAIDAIATNADSQGHSDEAEDLTRLIERLAESQDFTLSPEDRLFFDKLPQHHQTHLKKQSPKEFADEIRKLRMSHEVVEEMERRDKLNPNPEVIEFESLLPRGKQLPESSFPQDVIEFESLKADDEELPPSMRPAGKEWYNVYGPDDTVVGHVKATWIVEADREAKMKFGPEAWAQHSGGGKGKRYAIGTPAIHSRPKNHVLRFEPEPIEEQLDMVVVDDNHVSDVSMHAEVIKAPKDMKHSASVKEAFAELRAGTPKKKAH